MKKATLRIVVVVFLLFLLPCVSSAGHWEPYSCAICGRTVYEWEEDATLELSGSPIDIITGVPYLRKPQAEYIQWDCKYMVCPNCAKKYGEDLKAFMKQKASHWLLFWQDANQDLRKKHNADRKIEKIEELGKRIDKIQKELKQLKEE